MQFNVITSKENSLIKLVSLLQTKREARRENGLFVLEGLRICEDAMLNGIRFDKLIFTKNAYEKSKDKIIELANNSVECFEIPENLFKKISDTKSPQGIIAIAKIPDFSKNEINPNGRYIALENLSDPSNLGAVCRTCEALGVSGIILSDDSCDPYSPKVLRASMGTILRMNLFVLNNFSVSLKETGLKIYSSVVQSDALSINNINFTDGSVVVIGNEANGITDETKLISDSLFTIPMTGRAESLNAATAAAICIWEMMK